jgi:hypothetical protein
MNLLSDLSSELAEAILIGRKETEKNDSKQARELLAHVFEILQPIAEEKSKTWAVPNEPVNSANH